MTGAKAYIFFSWILLEDLLRKYLGNNMAIYFAKDGLALLIYLSFFKANRTNLVNGSDPHFLLRYYYFSFSGYSRYLTPAPAAFSTV